MTSHRELVGRALEQLAAALEPFVSAALADKVPAGAEWTALLAARDGRDGSPTRSYAPDDIQVQLRALTERLLPGWYPFDGRLSRSELALASELRETRNSWSHMTAFSYDDTYRALDSCERLARAAGAPVQADGIKQMRIALHKREIADRATAAPKSRADLPRIDYADLPPWRTVLRPRQDIAEGRYAASEFAADLHEVAEGRAEAEYGDPVEFFRRTYITEGLRELLRRAAARVTLDPNADPVINLQTNFGGGKTHSMLAVWHLVGGTPVGDLPQAVQEAVSGLGDRAEHLGRGVRRAAVVGNEIPPGQPMVKEDGTQVSTLWGEIAWQLGGRPAYDMIRESDEHATNPGTHLKTLLAAHAPCVILIDEWVAYARGLYNREGLPGGSFETQFSFAQTLTEAVSATPGALLLVSIPASDSASGAEKDASELEIGGAHGRQALEKLQHVVGRYAYEWRPATSQESFEIVRRRLFEEPTPDDIDRIAGVARAFGEMYRKHTGEFPRETVDLAYEARIRAAYPLHPELFERLYTDWSSLERFQRTRGVLRLMSAVVHSLYTAQDTSPLIMPGSMPLDALGVRDEVAKYLDDNWKPIVESDIDGPESVPVRIDEERPLFGRRALTRRIARALFLGSAATLRSAHKGIQRQRLFLGVAQPGDTVGNFGSSLQMLRDRATYLYSDDERYWFDTQPSLNRKAAEAADALADEDVWAEIVGRLEQERRQPGCFGNVVVAPRETGAVPEADTVTLVLMHPSMRHAVKHKDSTAAEFAARLLNEHGRAARANRNMLVALAADVSRYDALESAVRQYLAWRGITERLSELDLTDSNKAMVRRRLDENNRTVTSRIAEAYIHVFYATQLDGARPLTVSSLKLDSSETRLAERVGKKLERDQLIVSRLGVRNVRLGLDGKLRARWNTGQVSFGELWGYYRQFPYLDRVRNQRVLADAVLESLSSFAWEDDAFALATGYDEETGDFEGLTVPGGDATFGPVVESTLLVAPPLALAQIARETEAAAAVTPQPQPPAESGRAPGRDDHQGAGEAPTAAASVIRNASFTARFNLDVERDLEPQVRDIAREILAHIRDAQPDVLDIKFEARADKLSSFDDWTVRTVTENAAQLGQRDTHFRDA